MIDIEGMTRERVKESILSACLDDLEDNNERLLAVIRGIRINNLRHSITSI